MWSHQCAKKPSQNNNVKTARFSSTLVATKRPKLQCYWTYLSRLVGIRSLKHLCTGAIGWEVIEQSFGSFSGASRLNPSQKQQSLLHRKVLWAFLLQSSKQWLFPKLVVEEEEMPRHRGLWPDCERLSFRYMEIKKWPSSCWLDPSSFLLYWHLPWREIPKTLW